MKPKDQQLLEEAYRNILKEETSLNRSDDVFETYETVGMSADMGLQELITSTVQQILKEVPQHDQTRVRIAVKGLWVNMINNWVSLEGYED